MAMKTGTSVASIVLVTAMALVCVLSPSASSTTRCEILQRAPPDAFLTVQGFVYEADGVTPVVDCLVNVTNKNTGAWGLTMTDDTYGIYAFNTENLGWPPPGQNDVINVTATKGSRIGWNEVVVGNAFIVLWIDVTFSASGSSFPLKLVQGWNFVSIPVIDCDYRASTLGLAYGSMVVGWNTLAGNYDRLYVVGISPSPYDFEILPGEGCEIYSATGITLSLLGTAPAGPQTREVSVPEGGGWVALGLLGLNSSRQASDIPGMHDIPGSISTVIAYDAAAGRYLSYFPIAPFTDFKLAAGQAFWIWCDESGALSYHA